MTISQKLKISDVGYPKLVYRMLIFLGSSLKWNPALFLCREYSNTSSFVPPQWFSSIGVSSVLPLPATCQAPQGKPN